MASRYRVDLVKASITITAQNKSTITNALLDSFSGEDINRVLDKGSFFGLSYSVIMDYGQIETISKDFNSQSTGGGLLDARRRAFAYAEKLIENVRFHDAMKKENYLTPQSIFGKMKTHTAYDVQIFLVDHLENEIQLTGIMRTTSALSLLGDEYQYYIDNNHSTGNGDAYRFLLPVVGEITVLPDAAPQEGKI